MNEVSIQRKKEHYFTFEIPIEYDNKHPINNVEEYIKDLFPDKLIPMIRQIIGYSMTNLYDLKKFFILFGNDGDNGKSIFVNLIFKNILGKFYGSVNENLFYKQTKNSGQAQAFYNTLEGKRTGVLSETSNDTQADNAKIKRLTGGDDFTFRGLFEKEEKEMVCKAKLFLNTNRTIQFDTSDDPFLKRILIIPFINKF